MQNAGTTDYLTQLCLKDITFNFTINLHIVVLLRILLPNSNGNITTIIVLAQIFFELQDIRTDAFYDSVIPTNIC